VNVLAPDQAVVPVIMAKILKASQGALDSAGS
jgi:hypothetical protein